MPEVAWHSTQDIVCFPSVAQALSNPDGLLLAGGNLSVGTLQLAYQQGIFPWFEDEDPIMWWSPSIRAVIPTDAIYISKNMAKLARSQRYHMVADSQFGAVIEACSGRKHTWITDEMRQAYYRMHRKGLAHSIEVYDENEQLVGGLYGVFVKNIFCGESMFSLQPNTSKLALISLARFLQKNDCPLIDCQMPTAHLISMGAIEMLRADFIAELEGMRDNNSLLNTTWINQWQLY